MSDRIQGLSISLDMESALINRSLSEIKRSMRGLNSEAKITTNNMKFGARDTASYKKNLDQLIGTTEKQRNNVEALGKQYSKVVTEQGASSKSAQNLAIEYNKQADNLNRLETQLEAAKDGMHELYVEQSKFTKMSDTFKGISSGLDTASQKMHSFGSTMTRRVTAPVLGLITAAGGITAAFGWNRLIGIDNARAQLQGMGYDAKEVEGITGEVSDAIQGGMMTMAEGTATAAGAMAAGVERGDELAKYLQLVDAAAVGANRPINEMAQIFNRVQGSGKLMTEELNMIEDGMPGFSNAMAEHLSVAPDEFRKMVSAGEVSSDDFLTVMDGFAGGMAEAFSGTFSGMVQNTKAWIGILGQNLLGGVFEQSKESIGEFMELLKSDDLQSWATETGEQLGVMFSNLVENIKSGVSWFMKLGSEKQKLIGIVGLVVVGIGPLATVLATVLSVLSTLTGAIGGITAGLATLAGGFKMVMSGLRSFAVVFPKLAGLFSIITGPIGLTVAAIVGLGAAFIAAYNRSQTFRDFISNIGTRIQEAMAWLGQFKDGVMGLFVDDGSGGVDILTSIGISEEMANRLNDMVGRFFEFKWRVEEIIENVKTAFQGIFAIFRGDDTQANSLLRSIGLSEDTIDKIFLAVTNIQNAFTTIKNYVTSALSTITAFVGEKIAQIVSFWNTDGQQILQAVRNIFTGISTAISTAINFAVPIIRGGLNIILSIFQFVWPAVLFVVQMVWENIKGVINGGLRIIQGLVQTFSGIFTGDFSKMWEGVKNIFSGAIEFVWNLFQLMFWGRIIKGITAFIRGGISLFRNFGSQTGSVFTSMWQAVVRIFTNLWQGGVRIFNNMRTSLTNTVQNINTRINGIISRLVSAVLGFFRNLFSNGVRIFNNLRTSLTTTVGNIRSGITTRISDMVNSVVRFFQNLLSRGREIFTNLRTSIVDRISRMRQGVVDGVTRMRDRALEIYRNLKDKAAEFLTDMVDGAKKLPGRIGDGIKNMASKAVDGIKSLGNSMVGKLGEVVNGVIKGINNITGKLGITATIDKWDVPTFSTGTAGGGSLVSNGRIAQDTLATVGDRGPGNGSGTRELVQYPNGTAGLYDNDATIFAPRGTVIWNNRQTEEILAKNPQFSRGTVGGSGTDKEQKKDKKKGLLGTIGDVLSNTWDYITNPGKALQAVIDNVAPDFSGLKGFAGTIVKGGFNFIKDKALDWLTGIFKDNEGGNVDGSSILGKKILQTFGRYTGGISFNGGKHYGIDTAHKFDPLISPTDGKVTRVWNDYGGGKSLQITSDKYIWWFMHLSKIMKEVGDMVKAGMRVGTTGSSGNFVVGSGHLHTQVHPKSKGAGNHNAIDPLPILKGLNSHMLGGRALTDGLVRVHKGEYIVNPNHPTEAMKLIALAGKQVAAKSKQTKELPNISGNTDNGVMNRLLEATLDQLEVAQEQNRLLAKILKKELRVDLDGEKITKTVDEHHYNEELLWRLKNGRKRGVPMN